jgi:hypothetical protein
VPRRSTDADVDTVVNVHSCGSRTVSGSLLRRVDVILIQGPSSLYHPRHTPRLQSNQRSSISTPPPCQCILPSTEVNYLRREIRHRYGYFAVYDVSDGRWIVGFV